MSALLTAPKPSGRPAIHDRRELVNAMLYILREGYTWWALSHDFPAWQTVYDSFRQWHIAGIWTEVNASVRGDVLEFAGRVRQPTGAELDSKMAKTTEKGSHAATMARKTAAGTSGISSRIRPDC